MLGTAFALAAIWALQTGHRWWFVVCATLTVASSALAFLLLLVVLVGITLALRPRPAGLRAPAAALGAVALVEVVLWRMFPDHGRYPFSPEELAAACIFCGYGLVLTWNVTSARLLRGTFLAYLPACVAAYVVASPVGENIARLRFAALPVAVLACSLRSWRPRLLCGVAVALALSWNATPIAGNFVRGASDPSAAVSYWTPTIAFLHRHLTASYRVEAVDTSGHWAAVYLPRAGIPLARGWFRQDDFPQNSLLYSRFGPRAYLAWLRALGVRYVVLTTAPTDYSARAEAQLLRSGRSGLAVVLRTRNATVFAVPSPRRLISGPGAARVLAFGQTRLRLRVAARGTYRIAVTYSAYWRASAGCLDRTPDGMTLLTVHRPGVIELAFTLNAARALSAVTGGEPDGCG
jgi:hypothetical protein